MDEGGPTTVTSTLARCGECGYWLKDLPAAGNCPECGHAYDDRCIVLLGWARGSHGSVSSSRGLALVGFMAMFFLQLGIHGLISAVGALFTWSAHGLLLWAAYGMMVAVVLLGRWDRAIRETTRVLLDDRGYRQEAIPHTSPLSALMPLAIICYMMAVGLTSEKPITKREIVVGLAIVGVIAGMAGVVWMVRRCGHGERPARTTPWGEAAEACLSGEGNGRYQIRIDKRGRWVFEDVVNMDLDLTIPQRDELERRLEAWVPKKPRKMGLG